MVETAHKPKKPKLVVGPATGAHLNGRLSIAYRTDLNWKPSKKSASKKPPKTK